MLVMLVGGARSGKSALACELAAESAQPVVFLATAQADDEEFARRIERHRASRPGHWVTVEEPLEAQAALRAVEPGDTVIVDCLTLWVANLLAYGRDEEVIVEAAAVLAAEATARPGLVIVVSNEVGSGIVPEHELARCFRDVLGRVNAAVSLAADRAYLVAAGRLLALEHPAELRSVMRL